MKKIRDANTGMVEDVPDDVASHRVGLYLGPWQYVPSEADQIKLLQGRIDRLDKALSLAINILEKGEPADSRAMSGEFVALASVACGNEDTGIMSFIDDALKARGIDH